MKPDKITVVPLTPELAKEASVLEALCFSEPWSENAFISACGDKSYCILAALDGDGVLLGYCGAYGCLDFLDITNIAVYPSHRELGIASLLLSELFEAAKSSGITSVRLEVRASNAPAIRLYEKHGFLADGIRKSFYRLPTEDALLMTKIL